MGSARRARSRHASRPAIPPFSAARGMVCAPALRESGRGVRSARPERDATCRSRRTARRRSSPIDAKGATRHVLVWGAINALTPDSGKPQVRFKHDYSGGLKTQHRAVWVSFVNDCRPYDGPTARLLRCRLQGARRLVLGAPALAAQPAAPRLEAVDVVAARLGAPPLALGRAARAGRPLHGLGVQRRGARHLRAHVIRGQAGARLPYDVERGADRHVRAQPLHRHARLGVRAWLGTRDVDRLPQADGLVLLLVLADARRVAAGRARHGPPGTATATGSASSGRA